MVVNSGKGWKNYGNNFLNYVNDHNGTLCYECLDNLCDWDSAY